MYVEATIRVPDPGLSPQTDHIGEHGDAFILWWLNEAIRKSDPNGTHYVHESLFPVAACEFEYCPSRYGVMGIISFGEKSQSTDGTVMHRACWTEYDRMWRAAGQEQYLPDSYWRERTGSEL